jgi:hypothetical protein
MFTITLFAISVYTLIGPAEKSLGTNVRVVYLHGAWIWGAIASYLAAAITGLFGLIMHRESLQRWSRSLGRTGLVFWITSLPIAIWAMQTNWNGLYLAEPRFRLAVIFAITGLLIQIGLAIADNLTWASIANLAFTIALIWTLRMTQDVMHPSSPIYQSDARLIQVFFSGLVLLTLLLAWQVARLWMLIENVHQREDARLKTSS